MVSPVERIQLKESTSFLTKKKSLGKRKSGFLTNVVWQEQNFTEWKQLLSIWGSLVFFLFWRHSVIHTFHEVSSIHCIFSCFIVSHLLSRTPTLESTMAEVSILTPLYGLHWIECINFGLFHAYFCFYRKDDVEEKKHQNLFPLLRFLYQLDLITSYFLKNMWFHHIIFSTRAVDHDLIF